MRQGLLLSVLLAACGGERTADPAVQPPAAPPLLQHDFGVIRHGRAAEHDFVLDTRAVLGPDFVAVGVQADCSCAHAQLLLRDRIGNERPATGQPFAEFAARPDEVLVVRMQIDTAQKEAVDLGPVDSRASVLLQPLRTADPFARVAWPLLFRYAIDSPVTLHPFAVLDFGKVPASQRPELLTTIRGDGPEPLRLGAPASSDPRLQLSVEPGEGHHLLRARFVPDSQLGAFRILVTVPTELADDYEVRLAAVGKVVPDLEATPMDKLSLRTDLRREQTQQQAATQYLIVTDHDRSRSAEFRVARLVDRAGRDRSGSFEVRFEPIPGDARSHRMFLRYLGGIEGEFRGELVLAKDPRDGPFLSIEVVAFHMPQP